MKRIRIVVFLMVISQYCFGQYWDSLTGIINGDITVMAFDSMTNKLYAGGHFTQVGDFPIQGIAGWNGNQWDSLSKGIDYDTIPSSPNTTNVITRYGNYLFIGGAFRRVGHIWSPAFARWDGANWDTVPGGSIHLFHAVDDIRVQNNELFICGDFDSVGNVSANGIAKWDGSSWQAIGNNYNFVSQGYIKKIVFYHGNLYAGGIFKDPSNNTCHLAKWNGNNWQFMTNDLQGTFAVVADMEVYDDKLYVAGLFYASDGNAGNSIMSWNDTTWSAIGGSIQIVSNPYPTVKKIHVYNGKLYCVGNFEKIGGITAKGLASWDGVEWCGFNSDFAFNSQTCGASSIAFYNDTMYVGGGFYTANGDSIPFIAKWIGGNFVDTCGFISTAINEQTMNNFSVQIIPNPVNQNGIFQMTGLDGNKTLIIYDQLGQEIWRKETSENQIEFSVEGFSSGMYFYRVEQNREIKAIGKFLIE